jgi:hypothetical protein
MKKIFYCVYACTTASISANAIPQDNEYFSRLDNSINLSVGYGQFQEGSQFTSIIPGVNASILTSSNIWASLNVLGSSSYQSSAENIGQISSGYALYGKVGYGFILSKNWIIIPYGGIGYLNTSQSIHENSLPQYEYNARDFSMMAGIKPEYAISKSFKISLDMNISSDNYGEIYNTQDNQYLSHHYSSAVFINTSPAIQWNIFSNLNVGVYYQFSNMLSGTQANQNNQIGMSIGYLFK